jgi:hypothetical protein
LEGPKRVKLTADFVDCIPHSTLLLITRSSVYIVFSVAQILLSRAKMRGRAGRLKTPALKHAGDLGPKRPQAPQLAFKLLAAGIGWLKNAQHGL